MLGVRCSGQEREERVGRVDSDEAFLDQEVPGAQDVDPAEAADGEQVMVAEMVTLVSGTTRLTARPAIRG